MLLELYICVLRLINLMVYITETLLSTTTYSIFLCLREIPMWQFVVVVVQSLSHVRLFSTQWTAERQASLSFTISWCLLKLMAIESVIPFNHLILCRPLLLPPSVFTSIRDFSNEPTLCIRWSKN